MNFDDRIWGSFEINEPIIRQLIESPEIQRLKRIEQFGLPYRYYRLKGFTRYEHSVGVFLLLRKLKASLEEQVAGLLHDVSHTAFSHLSDWVIGDRKKEDYQDKRHLECLRNSSINDILNNHNFNSEKIAEYERYTLLELPSPDLCADRVDYAIREFQDWANPKIVNLCKESLINFNGRIVFNSIEPAEKFGTNFLRLQREHWGSSDKMLTWHLFSDILKYSIDKKIITIQDFSSNDESILKKLEESRDDIILTNLARLRSPLKYSIDYKNYDFLLYKKFRYVDPEYLTNRELKRLSAQSEVYKSLIDREKAHNSKGIGIKLIA